MKKILPFRDEELQNIQDLYPINLLNADMQDSWMYFVAIFGFIYESYDSEK